MDGAVASESVCKGIQRGHYDEVCRAESGALPEVFLESAQISGCRITLSTVTTHQVPLHVDVPGVEACLGPGHSTVFVHTPSLALNLKPQELPSTVLPMPNWQSKKVSDALQELPSERAERQSKNGMFSSRPRRLF